MHEYPNIWPQGGIFAFSGVDGPTEPSEPFTAYGARDGIGWTFATTPPITLYAMAGTNRLVSTLAPTDYCFADCWHCSVELGERRGYVTGGFVDRSSIAIAIVFDDLDDDEGLRLASDAPARAVGGADVYAGDGHWLAVVSGAPSLRRQFGIAISYESEGRRRAPGSGRFPRRYFRGPTEAHRFYGGT